MLTKGVIVRTYLLLVVLCSQGLWGTEENAPQDNQAAYEKVVDESTQLVKTAKKIPYVYTIRQKDFVGDTLFSLNQMKDKPGYEHIYERQVKKYEGRERLMELFIPTLQCYWNDVVFCSPVHPHLLYQELVKIGYKIPDREFFAIPVEVLKEKKVSWYYISPEPLMPTTEELLLSPGEFTMFDSESYEEIGSVPAQMSAYYREVFNPSCPEKGPLLFVHIPHVLSLDPICISDERITTIEWSEAPVE